MTAQALVRVQTSYEQLSGRLGPLTERFAARLCEVRPDLRGTFDARQAGQGLPHCYVGAALALIVRNLGMLDALEQSLRDLGAGHARAGVRSADYAVVVDALLRAMADTLGDAWTDQLARDWTALLLTVARTMLTGAAAPV